MFILIGKNGTLDWYFPAVIATSFHPIIPPPPNHDQFHQSREESYRHFYLFIYLSIFLLLHGPRWILWNFLERERECVYVFFSSIEIEETRRARVSYRRCEGRAHSPASRVLDGIGLIRGGNVPDLLLKPLENSARPGDTGRSNSIEWHARFRPLKKETKTNLTDRTGRPICIPANPLSRVYSSGRSFDSNVFSSFRPFRAVRNTLSRRNSLSREYFGRK